MIMGGAVPPVCATLSHHQHHQHYHCSYRGQDPALFVDDDDAAYLVWGCGGGITMAQLTDDLLSVKNETLVSLTEQLPNFYEGPWLHKYNGVYYLSYPTVDKECVW